jgi:hypothetical protein
MPVTIEDDVILDIRTLIPDTDAIYGEASDEYLFTDQEIARFYRLGRNSALRGAGYAMIAVGNSESMIEKVITTQDLQTDGSKLQDKWRLSGERLLARADKEDVEATLFDGFELIDYREGWLPYGPELTDPPTVWG